MSVRRPSGGKASTPACKAPDWGWARRDVVRTGLFGGAALALPPALHRSLPGYFHNVKSQGAGGTLTYALGIGPTVLDPHASGQNTPDFGFFRQVFDSLVFLDDRTGVMMPQLAASWKTLNPTTWEFTLRRGVTFHNGTPFDAKSVKYSIDRILNPNLSSAAMSRLQGLDGAEIVDSHTVRLTTKQPFPALLDGLQLAYIVPDNYYNGPKGRLNEPVGTGPFKFVSYTQGAKMTMVANTAYFAGAPKLDRLIFSIIPDDAARLATLKAGEADVILNMPLDAIDFVAHSPGLRVEHAFINASMILECDTLHGGPISNKLVRQALNYGIDRELINRTVLDGKLRLLDGQIITRGVLGYNPDVHAFPYNPAKAKELLKQAGYRKGLRLKLNGRVGKYTADRDIALAVVGQLQKIGVDAKFVHIDSGIWGNLQLHQKLGPLFLVAWYSFGNEPTNAIFLTDQSTYGIYYDNKAYQERVFSARRTLDRAKREQLYQQAMQVGYDDALAVYLFQLADYYGMSDRVSGFRPRADEIPVFHGVSLKG